MAVLWLCVISGMLATYAILDGLDLGSGVIRLFLARTETDRRAMPATAHPLWDGHEVWLLLAGGALYFAFPAIHASRGFYLAAIALLALLVLRGIGVAFRERVEKPGWRRLLDLAFAASNVLIAASLGIAIGGVMGSGVDWFPLLCGFCGLAVVTLQSACWMALNSTGQLQLRCRRLASYAWWAVVLCYAAIISVILAAQPQMIDSLVTPSRISALSAFAVIALAGLIGTRLCLSVGFDLGAVASGSLVVAGLVGSAAAGQTALPAVSAAWWLPAFLLTAGCIISVQRLLLSRLATKRGSARTA